LRPELGTDVTDESLSHLYGWTVLARGLSLSIVDFFGLTKLAGIQGCRFSTPREVLDFIDLCEQVAISGLTDEELKFILAHAPDSPHALRQEAIVAMLGDVRETLLAYPANSDELRSALEATLAGLFRLDRNRIALLLCKLKVDALSLWEVLSDQSLLKCNNTGKVEEITRLAFPEQFRAVELLHRVSYWLSRQPVVSLEDFAWMLGDCQQYGIMALTEMRSEADPCTSVPLARWVAFTRWRSLVEQFPEPEGFCWREAIEQAVPKELIGQSDLDPGKFWTMIIALTNWTSDTPKDLFSLYLPMGLASAAPVQVCCRLVQVLQTARRLGVSAAVMLPWRIRDSGEQYAIAKQIRDSARS